MVRLTWGLGMVLVLGTLVFCAAGLAADVVVVRDDSFAKRSPSEAGSVRDFTNSVSGALNAAGIEHEIISDTALEKEGGLSKYKVALFPHNRIEGPQLTAVEAFVRAGGKIIVFYGLPVRIGELLGIKPMGYVGGETGRTLFVDIRFRTEALPGLPSSIRQGSWNIISFEPIAGDGQVIGEWINADGQKSGYSAVSLNRNGMFMSHVLTSSDVKAKGRFLLAVIGHFVPEVWEKAASRVVGSAETIGRFKSVAEFEAFCRQQGRMEIMAEPLRRSAGLRQEAQACLAQKRYPEALSKAEEARRVLEESYPKLYPPRRGEMRAVWIHSPFNVADWDKACAHLAECGFNAVIVNLCNAGIAYYPSKYLPTEPRAAQEGDQIARVLGACRRHGLELHVWRVNWRISGNDQRLKELGEKGRLAVNFSGQQGQWLCPSWPENHQHEVDTMLEIVRNYDVDGIHFDYIRFNDSSYCYCDQCRRRFEQQIGQTVANWPQDVRQDPLKEKYLQFRRDLITSVVKEVSEKSRALKPWVKISAAVFGDWPASRVSIGQDAKLWVDEGYLDFVCPMNYTNDTQRLGQWTEAQVAAVRGQIPLYIGIGVWRHLDVTTFVDQLALARELGADGFVGFCYETPSVQDYISLTGQGITAGKTYMPHWAPEASFELPPGVDADHPTSYPVGTKITIRVTLTANSTLRQAVRRATASIQHQDAEGKVLLEGGQIVAGPGAQTKTVEVTVPAGRSRLVLDGRMELDDGSTREFVKRSAVIMGVPPAAQPAL